MIEEKKKLIKHGIQTWLRTGKINPSIRGHKQLQKYIREIENDLIADLGGRDNLSTQKEILIKGTVEAFGVLILASMYCKKESVLRPDKFKEGIIELQPVLGKQFIAFLNTIRMNLVALGLDRIDAEKILSPLEIAKEIDKEKAEKEKRDEK